jgi:arsenite oxidase small subunit
MQRRDFVKMCGSALALVYSSPRLLAQPFATSQHHNRVLLTGQDGKALSAAKLAAGAAYLFHYPFAGTPCFLINLNKAVKAASVTGGTPGKPSAPAYDWPGGVGKNQSIVAFSAICSHQFSYPSKKISFINYQHGTSKLAGRDQVIVCCAHQTVFDPTQGAKILSGPATLPLTTILLDYDTKTDQLYATGTLGKEQYEEYFRAYKRELIEQYGRGTAKQTVAGQTPVIPFAEYTSQQIQC